MFRATITTAYIGSYSSPFWDSKLLSHKTSIKSAYYITVINTNDSAHETANFRTIDQADFSTYGETIGLSL
jgi:hypothetical protein